MAKLQEALSDCLNQWKEITALDFCLLTEDGDVVFTTDHTLCPAPEALPDISRTEDAVFLQNHYYFRIKDVTTGFYILVTAADAGNAEGGVASAESVSAAAQSDSTAAQSDSTAAQSGSPAAQSGSPAAQSDSPAAQSCSPASASYPEIIGRLAVCQIRTILDAHAEKNDRNLFYQNLLLGRYTQSEILPRSRRLHLNESARRVILYVETVHHKDDSVLATLRSLFGGRTKDIILTPDERGIVIIRELLTGETMEEIPSVARLIVDMMNTEAMTSAHVSFSRPAEHLGQLKNAYTEALTAMEIGRIFYAERDVFGYNDLGIGRLIYQLPEDVCTMFIEESLHGASLDELDEETLHIIRTFFKNDLNLAVTSRELYVHRNTLVYRLEKLAKHYSLDIRSFEDAMTFQIAMMVSDYLKLGKQK